MTIDEKPIDKVTIIINKDNGEIHTYEIGFPCRFSLDIHYGSLDTIPTLYLSAQGDVKFKKE